MKRIAVRIITVALAGVVLWTVWIAISSWLSFRSIDRITADLDRAQEAIAELPVDERPEPPPVEPEPGVPADAAGEDPESAPEPAPAIIEPALIDWDELSSPRIPDEAFDAFLIIGSDARAGLGGSRADVIMLALLPSDGSSPILVSLPRDLWLLIACWETPNRINAALNGCGTAATGPELLALTVADFTGIVPDHFALFDFEDFERVIDAFGGIEICVDFEVRDAKSKLDLPAGCTKADGDQALAWVRSRRTEEFRDGAWRPMEGVNDLTRNARQRDVLLQLLGKVNSFSALTALTEIVESIANAVTLDAELSIGEAIGLGWDLRDVAPAQIRQITIPVKSHRTASGAQVLLQTKPFADVLAEVWPTGG